MRDSIYRLTLDMHDVASQVQITAKKNDIAREIHVSLTENGLPYTIERGSSAVIMIRKPDGTILNNDCDIRLSDSVIVYEFTAQTVAVEGLCECEIRLYGASDEQVTSPRFTMRVSSTVYDDGQTESQSEFTTLLEAISDCNNLGIEVHKIGATTTLTITKKDGTTQSVTISDGDIDIETLQAMISVKADKVQGATLGHIATLDASGNLVDGGQTIENIMDIAQGKTSTYIISYDDNEAFNSQDDTVTMTSPLVDINGTTIPLASLRKGDIILVTETEVPDRWVSTESSSSVAFLKMEISKIDLSEYMPLPEMAIEGDIPVFYSDRTLGDSDVNISEIVPLLTQWTTGTAVMNEGDTLGTGKFYAQYQQ